ncbi:MULTISPECIES: DUF5667 domain-containing protein [unclassified Kitasatospora]|uniref:DUF5667 domain-containing protein n=1 Tax=unclassified Kitasatospora TaxID=2633591 RepID=UPI00070B3A8F|nr:MULTISPECIES: DUF5667 domain-containing protein [unclassified Kitasatospora]KQV18635.1 hypothetical protein ASC99_05305 [Kitasatospora sp. Root107]KRB74617.1 hypothetical protein ASE03_19240 [Kitasatospora sp. Root187]
MTANMLEHRRARAFAEALEAHHVEPHQGDRRPGSSRPGGSTAMAELLTMADALGALPEPELSTEARTLQRAQLMAAFERDWTGSPAAKVPQQRRHRALRSGARLRWGRRLAIGGLVAGVAVGSFAGAAAASSNALPGDTLYGMKRGLEDLRLSWAGSDSEVGALLLDQASTRLEEAQGLLGRADTGATLSPATVEQVRRALDDMHAEAVKGRELLRSVYRSNGSLDPMRRLAGFADGEDDRWAAVKGQLPTQLTGQASKVNELFDEMTEDVAPLQLTPSAAKGNAPAAPGGAPQSPGGTAASPATGAGSATQPRTDPGRPNAGTGPGATTPSSKASPGLLDKLLPGVTGGGAASPAAGSPERAADAPAPAAEDAPQDQPPTQELRIPALIPGLLPEISLG